MLTTFLIIFFGVIGFIVGIIVTGWAIATCLDEDSLAEKLMALFVLAGVIAALSWGAAALVVQVGDNSEPTPSVTTTITPTPSVTGGR